MITVTTTYDMDVMRLVFVCTNNDTHRSFMVQGPPVFNGLSNSDLTNVLDFLETIVNQSLTLNDTTPNHT